MPRKEYASKILHNKKEGVHNNDEAYFMRRAANIQKTNLPAL